MRLGHAIRLGAWLLIGLNLLMALGAMGILLRMAPAIAVIIDRNEKSLQACEDMLAALALSPGMAVDEAGKIAFAEALARAQNNVTEAEEPLVLAEIAENRQAALQGDLQAREKTVAAIARLGRVNRSAMVAADNRARQLGQAGVWGVVFMALAIFTVGLILVRHLNRQVIRPLEEIHAVIAAQRNRECIRRCSGVDLPPEIRSMFTGINEILDRCQTPLSGPHPTIGNDSRDEFSEDSKKFG